MSPSGPGASVATTNWRVGGTLCIPAKAPQGALSTLTSSWGGKLAGAIMLLQRFGVAFDTSLFLKVAWSTPSASESGSTIWRINFHPYGLLVKGLALGATIGFSNQQAASYYLASIAFRLFFLVQPKTKTPIKALLPAFHQQMAITPWWDNAYFSPRSSPATPGSLTNAFRYLHAPSLEKDAGTQLPEYGWDRGKLLIFSAKGENLRSLDEASWKIEETTLPELTNQDVTYYELTYLKNLPAQCELTTSDGTKTSLVWPPASADSSTTPQFNQFCQFSNTAKSWSELSADEKEHLLGEEDIQKFYGAWDSFATYINTSTLSGATNPNVIWLQQKDASNASGTGAVAEVFGTDLKIDSSIDLATEGALCYLLIE